MRKIFHVFSLIDEECDSEFEDGVPLQATKDIWDGGYNALLIFNLALNGICLTALCGRFNPLGKRPHYTLNKSLCGLRIRDECLKEPKIPCLTENRTTIPRSSNL
jgi:hypothetical protein